MISCSSLDILSIADISTDSGLIGIWRWYDTGTVCNHTSSSHLVRSLQLKQTQYSMERSPCFKCPGSLIILAFEKEIQLGVCRPYTLKLCTNQCLGTLRCRRYVVESLGRKDCCSADVRLDERVSTEDILFGDW